MTYVNTTGKHIGECLTGFGSVYPVFICNSGNSDVEYKIDFTNPSTEFFVSKNEFIIDNGSSGKFDIFYKPTITASTATDITKITIFGQSIEDGSVDPSGVITLDITGSRIISNTAGAVRRFVALRNYDVNKGLNYDFKWYPPTGTGSLHNYYFTGYTLDLSTSNNFSSIVYSKEISISKNTDDDPRFASYYGFPESEIIQNISKNDYPELDLETDYYARIYTYSTDNSGISIYATGIDSVSEQLSEEVILGFSGSAAYRPNIEFTKKPFNVYIENGNYIDYNLSKKIIDTNNGSADFSFYSGINIYFPNNSSFSSSSYAAYAVNLNNIIFRNFTGDANPTRINFYIPHDCRVQGNFGKGGDIPDFYPIPHNIIGLTNQKYLSRDPSCSDSEAGGNVFKLDAQTTVNSNLRTDIVYNLFVEKTTLLQAGGGGNKAGVAFVGGDLYSVGVDQKNRDNNVPLNGSYNKFGINTKFNFYYQLRENPNQSIIVKNGGLVIRSSNAGVVYSSQSGYGEDGSDFFYIKIFNLDGLLNAKVVGFYYKPTTIFTDFNQIPQNVVNKTMVQTFDLRFNKMPGSVSQCGNLLKKYSNSSVRLSYYNTEIPSDYIFRLENTFLTSTSSWLAKNKNGSTIFTLNTPSPSGLTYNSNFNSTGYRALSIKNGSLSGNISASSDSFKNFDLYIVGCFNRPIIVPKVTSIINWYRNSTNISSKNVLCKKFPNTEINSYLNESNVFNFFFSLLYDYKINNYTDETFLIFNRSAANSYYQLSSSLVTSSYNIYPFILNIKRNGTIYSIYINGDLHTFYDLNFETPQASRNLTNFMSSILNTTFKLENNDSAGDGITTTFFDLLCFNRILFDDENRKVHNSLLQSYIKLFSGVSANDYLNINDRIRFPNSFNLAGRISA